MESVEAVTAAAAEPTADAPPPASVSSSGQKRDLSQQRLSSGAAAGTVESRQAADSWASLLSAGLKLVESLTNVSTGKGEGAAAAISQWIETDAETGRAYVKLPVPDAQVLQSLADALSRLVSSLAK